MLHEWWFWAAAGIAFGILEMLVPGYILLGFGLGAFVVAVLLPVAAALDIGWISITELIFVFAIASLVGWLVLRLTFGRHKGQVKVWTRDINDN